MTDLPSNWTPDQNAPLYTLSAEDLAKKLEAEQGALSADKSMCALTIWEVLNQGCSLDDALSLSEQCARETAGSFGVKSVWLGCAIVMQSDTVAYARYIAVMNLPAGENA